MEYPSLFPETVLQLYRAFFYCMAFILAGGALIGLSIYLVLVGSEMFFSEPRPKSQPAKAPQSARRAPVAEETVDLSCTETPILAPREPPEEEAVRVPAHPESAHLPMTVPANLESESTWAMRFH